jgi:hypothetical protein
VSLRNVTEVLPKCYRSVTAAYETLTKCYRRVRSVTAEYEELPPITKSYRLKFMYLRQEKQIFEMEKWRKQKKKQEI